MARLKPIADDKMTAEQAAVRDAIVAGPRGGLGGPFHSWLRSPDLANRAQALGEFCRFNTSFPPRLSELAILITARRTKAQFEWYAHAPIALKAGLSESIIEAIRRNETPHFTAADEQAVYDFVRALQHTSHVGDAAFQAVVNLFGEKGAVELVGISGYYTLVAYTLNTFEVSLPSGEPLPLAD